LFVFFLDNISFLKELDCVLVRGIGDIKYTNEALIIECVRHIFVAAMLRVYQIFRYYIDSVSIVKLQFIVFVIIFLPIFLFVFVIRQI
jgi:hypothetical protein